MNTENIYFLRTEPFAGYLKIGRTKHSVEKMVLKLEKDCSFMLIIYKQFNAPMKDNLKFQIGKLLKDKKRTKDWIDMTLEDVDNVCKILGY